MSRLHQLQRISLRRQSVALLALVNAYEETLSELRRKIASTEGGSGFSMNRYPVSGGICEHWQEWQKDAVRELVDKKNKIMDEALSLWRQSGAHLRTFKMRVQEIVG